MKKICLFISNAYYYSNGYHSISPSFSTLKNQIDNDRPYTILLINHSYYDDHFVFVVGYYSFTYAGGSDSNYLRIADGFDDYPNRYVHTTIGYDSGGYIRSAQMIYPSN